ncbi:CDP-glycerol glycerophosphotransferase family protein [Bacillus sp. ISL-35]|uniref:CDP-glycerol glycerophosphotransferase family protein n=1 Tax=Bacillus sp. ISL-35 TaxID=2819122 RepID=UPI001BEA44B2|nr:CDP-glycerol glycerophosphotransferase family protein [Bacillus sp. ISL-35]MBT2678841.1 CDP-glycerol glycerophosphotransferase family protein [Bacillus sp. ISL-35]MBT2703833.1 CDP-glycerol glycerophosphotransferase family protein [Chryseobacterium sp. ISL-80]
MVRELSISIYLLFFKMFFTLFNTLPLKDKVTFIVSFGDNTQYVYEEMRRQNLNYDVVFLCKGKSINLFKDYESATIIPFETNNIIYWLKSVYHIATSHKIVVDNYFGFFAAINLRQGVETIQLWHATGAIKKFGLQDESVKFRSAKAKDRFKKVYNSLDKVIVGSDIMESIFIDAFGLDSSKLLKTGIPRTDFFFDAQKIKESKQRLFGENQALNEKKVILYAPTYRDNELNQFKLQLDLEQMAKDLGDQFVLVLRLHPAVKNNVDYSAKFPGFVFDYSSPMYEINDLLLIADILISDYSSIPFEFSLMRKPMIFYMYDLDQYKKERGIWTGMIEEFPGPIVKDTHTIVEMIQNNAFDLNMINQYARKWNKYSRGQSSKNLVSYMFNENQAYQKQRAL